MIKRNKALVSTLLAAICLSTTVSGTVINEKKVYAETNEAAVESEITDNESTVEETEITYSESVVEEADIEENKAVNLDEEVESEVKLKDETDAETASEIELKDEIEPELEENKEEAVDVEADDSDCDIYEEETVETYGSDNDEVILEAAEGADFATDGENVINGLTIRIGDFTFRNERNNYKVDLLRYHGTDSNADVVIPSKIKVKGVLYDVVCLGNSNGLEANCGKNLFYGKKVNSVTIPDSITKIGTSVFRDSTINIPLTLPKKLEYIGLFTFRNCTGINDIVIPSTLETIGQHAFYGCQNLKKVFIEDGAKFGQVGNYLSNCIFEKCPQLQYVRLPENLTKIPQNMFYGCSNLKNLQIPDSVTTIEGEALSGTGIKSLVLPYNLKEVEYLSVLNLTDVVIQNTNESAASSIYNKNFENTNTRVWVANNDVKQYIIEHSSSYDMTNHTSRVNNVEVGQPPIAGDWNEDQATVNIYGIEYRRENTEASTVDVSGYSKVAGGLGIPSDISVGGKKYKVTGIADNAFAGNTDLTSAEIWGYTKNIGKNIFNGCSNITTIRLYDGIENISIGAFDGCSASFVVDSEDLKEKVIASGVDESRITLLSEAN